MERSEATAGIRRQEIPEPTETTEEPEPRAGEREAGKARQSDDEPEKEEDQTLTVESPDGGVNQESKDPDSKSGEGGETF